MNLSSPVSKAWIFLFRMAIKIRRILPKERTQSFGIKNAVVQSLVEQIIVINLDRQPARLKEVEKELRNLIDYFGKELWHLTERYAAIDANSSLHDSSKDSDIDQFYTLGEQLFVEPQPLSMPTQMDLNSPIRMSQQEIAVARSHINIWRKIANSNNNYVLILEDDIWFLPGFANKMDKAWNEINNYIDSVKKFDILYLSYKEVKNGAPKSVISKNIFRPERGLWFLSGYIISREGARKLLELLPCKGPIDLWVNHQFKYLNILAISQPIISQRQDVFSTNSYSILPSLTKIGAITSEGAALFNIRPIERPVFAFGTENSGLSSLAMGLSMLGYRCCSDLQSLPNYEKELLLKGNKGKVFDAYVNIKSLLGEIETLKKHYPQAKYIIATSDKKNNCENYFKILKALNGLNFIVLKLEEENKWKVVCEYLRCSPPISSFPKMPDLGQRPIICENSKIDFDNDFKTPKRDKSPWVINSNKFWHGIQIDSKLCKLTTISKKIKLKDCLGFLNTQQWFLRNDTFTGNLGLFKPDNIEFRSDQGMFLTVKKESMGVREYSASSITSCHNFLFGRFEASIKASKTPGVITGFFLHRDSPRQEIDIEITGNRTDRLLVNVFYNPGDEGAKFDYGYRGSPSFIKLGFDASESYHQYAIEWDPTEIRWFVDNRLVHRRVNWDPTPIPHLPMALNLNIWPSRSRELAGRLNERKLPTTTYLKSISIDANILK